MPWSSLVTVRENPVAGFVSVTVAPETTAPLGSVIVPRRDVVADCANPKVPRVSRPARMTATVCNRERIGSSLAAKGFFFPKYVLPRYYNHTIPQGSDGALLCNFETTMFKKNLQG